MEPETLEAILKYTSLAVGGITTIVGLNIFTGAISKYNQAKDLYNNKWTKIEKETKSEEVKRYVAIKKEKIGEPNLKQYFKDSTKELVNTLLGREPCKTHYNNLLSSHGDIIYDKGKLESGFYYLNKNNEVVDKSNKNNNLKIVS
ncbi:hypothetical protein KO361_02810 [Candidatus Woesearchaeota archaeon]|nr:hypothetical protein [Candidatus Woesearchaeota archaeon]